MTQCRFCRFVRSEGWLALAGLTNMVSHDRDAAVLAAADGGCASPATDERVHEAHLRNGLSHLFIQPRLPGGWIDIKSLEPRKYNSRHGMEEYLQSFRLGQYPKLI